MILRADSVAKSYRGIRVLTSARLELEAGTLTFLAGRNGSGKSTLLRICAGTLQPDSCRFEYRGKQLTRFSLAHLARHGLFYLPDREIFAPDVPIEPQLDAIAARFGRSSYESAVNELQLDEILQRPPKALSGGELRRAEVGAAVVRSPSCLISDEPLRGIDPKDREIIVGCFKQMADSGCAVVASGHNSTELLGASDHVFWVRAGTTCSFESPAEAMANDHFRKEYLVGQWS